MDVLDLKGISNMIVYCCVDREVDCCFFFPTTGNATRALVHAVDLIGVGSDKPLNVPVHEGQGDGRWCHI